MVLPPFIEGWAVRHCRADPLIPVPPQRIEPDPEFAVFLDNLAKPR